MKQQTTITTSTKRPEGTDCWQHCCLRWFFCVSDYVWKRLSLHECFLSLRSALLNVFCCMIPKKKKKRRGGEGVGAVGWNWTWDLRICKDIYFFPRFFLFSSSFVYFYFFAIIFIFQMFLYHCNCWHWHCLSVFVYLDCVGEIYLAHISEEKTNNRMYQVLYPGNLVLLYVQFTSCACSRQSFF